MDARGTYRLCIALLVTAALGPALPATEQVATIEGLECAVCHETRENTILSDRGRYYQYLRTLQGYELVVQRFGRCTYCHVREIGSVELTKQGERFRWMMEDMEGLRAWLEENHPKPADEAEAPDSPATTSDDDQD